MCTGGVALVARSAGRRVHVGRACTETASEGRELSAIPKTPMTRKEYIRSIVALTVAAAATRSRRCLWRNGANAELTPKHVLTEHDSSQPRGASIRLTIPDTTLHVTRRDGDFRVTVGMFQILNAAAGTRGDARCVGDVNRAPRRQPMGPAVADSLR
jgi:hypothetical protein